MKKASWVAYVFSEEFGRFCFVGKTATQKWTKMTLRFSPFLIKRGKTDFISRDLSSLCHLGHRRGHLANAPHTVRKTSVSNSSIFYFRLLWCFVLFFNVNLFGFK